MTMTRREVLGRAVSGIGAGALLPGMPLFAQDAEAALVARLDGDLRTHASFGEKFSGGHGDTSTASWIAARLRTSGFDVQESAFDAPFFVRRRTTLTAGRLTAEVEPQAPVVATGAGGVRAPLALVEGESVGDVAGRIVVYTTPSARHAALFADRGIGKLVTEIAARGAAAIVIVTNGPTGEAIALNAPETPFVPVPTAVLAPREAAGFIAAARAGDTAVLVLDGEATHRPCKNVVGVIERSDEWLVISTPRSGWYDCVGERGTGTAVFLELADWAARRFPETSVFVMNTGGHEYFFAGSHRVLHLAPPPEQTFAWAHIGATLAVRDAVEKDGHWTMLDTADPARSLMASAAASAAAAEGFAGLSGLEAPTPIRPQAGELSTFTDLGYARAFAVLGVHPWFHTRLDTLERVDARLLVPVLAAHQRTIERLHA
jgi:hypothetical protein